MQIAITLAELAAWKRHRFDAPDPKTPREPLVLFQHLLLRNSLAEAGCVMSAYAFAPVRCV